MIVTPNSKGHLYDQVRYWGEHFIDRMARQMLYNKTHSRILAAWGRCTGTTQRDGTGREEGGGRAFRMGNTCIPAADS